MKQVNAPSQRGKRTDDFVAGITEKRRVTWSPEQIATIVTLEIVS
ncbi:MAG: hypothetical protein RR224_07795 [Clostridia bacterium]